MLKTCKTARKLSLSIAISKLPIYIFLAAMFGLSCEKGEEQRFVDFYVTPRGEDELVWGRSLWLYGKRILLGSSYEELSRLYPPPVRLSSEELLFQYDDDVVALFADVNNNRELDGEDYLLALTVGSSCKSKSAEGFGIGTHRREIIKAFGYGQEIEPTNRAFIWGNETVLVFWKYGVAFQFTPNNLVRSLTIFLPSLVLPNTKLSVQPNGLNLGQIPLNGGPYPRSLVWLILGNADISVTTACGSNSCFIDRYYLWGFAMRGRTAGDLAGIVNELIFTYPMDLGEVPAWDSTTDDLLNLYDANYTLIKNSSHFAAELVFLYTIGKVHIAFCYQKERLTEITVYYETFGENL